MKAFYLMLFSGLVCLLPLVLGMIPINDVLLRDYPKWNYLFLGSYGTLILFGLQSRLQNLKVLTLSLLLTLATLDLIGRILLVPYLYFEPQTAIIHRLPSLPEVVRYKKNTEMKMTSFGNLAARSKDVQHRDLREIILRTDELGFRNEPGVSSKPVDFILLGDSFTHGYSTSQETTWVSWLKRLYNIDAYTLGTPAGPWQELMNIQLEFPKLTFKKNRLIIWTIYEGNDLSDDYFDFYEPPQNVPVWNQMKVKIETFQNRSPIRILIKRAFMKRLISLEPEQSTKHLVGERIFNGRSMLFYTPHVMNLSRTEKEVRADKYYPRLVKTFTAMREFREKNNLEMHILFLPAKENVYEWLLKEEKAWTSSKQPTAFSNVVKQLAADNGFDFFDTRALQVEKSRSLYEKSGKTLWHYDDTHWNEEGYRFAAEMAYEKILKDYKMGKELSGNTR